MHKRVMLSVTVVGLLAGPPVGAQELPEAVVTKREMVVTANPLATAAVARFSLGVRTSAATAP